MGIYSLKARKMLGGIVDEPSMCRIDGEMRILRAGVADDNEIVIESVDGGAIDEKSVRAVEAEIVLDRAGGEPEERRCLAAIVRGGDPAEIAGRYGRELVDELAGCPMDPAMLELKRHLLEERRAIAMTWQLILAGECNADGGRLDARDEVVRKAIDAIDNGTFGQEELEAI